MADNDNKDFKPFGVNLSTVGRFGGAGVLGGSSAAAALVLVKMLKDLSAERRALTQPTEEEKNTITLTLPKRAAADCSAGADCAAEALEHELEQPAGPVVHTKPYKAVHSDKSEDNKRVAEKFKVKSDHPRIGTRAATTPRQIRSTDGKYNVKTANWQTLAASLLALGAGGSLGYSLVNKVYDIKKKRELDSRLTAAKQEYLDMLGATAGTEKTAGLLGSGTRKGDPSFSMLDYPGGLAALALLLGSGSTAWLTKKVLDEYNKDPESKFKPQQPVHIDRIVFRSEGSGELPSMQRAEADQIKESSDNSAQEVAEAALGIYLDLMSGRADILGTVKCGAALLAAGQTPEDMYKLASEDYDRLVQYLKQNPGLRTAVKRMVMEKHPILKYFKWTSDLPLIKAYTDSKMYNKLSDRYGPASDIMDSARRGDSAVDMAAKLGSVKSAGLPSLLGSASAGTTGGLLASMMLEKSQQGSGGQQPEAAPQESDAQRAARVEKMVENIQLGAKDPRALAFVQQNSEKLRNILLLLAEEGKI